MKKTFTWRSICILSMMIAPWWSHAARVDTVETYSVVMKKTIKAVVVTPDSYAQGATFPATYLLHGYSGDYSGWIRLVKGLEQQADLYQMILVCPDGGFSSWYWDSPVDPAFQYETYISKELIEWMDSRYKTIRSAKGRAITGLSMGGHGALYLALRHPDVFGAAGSMSGGVDIRPFPNNWDMARRLGAYAEFPERWEQHTVINLLHLYKPNGPTLIIDCGTEDFFFKVNEELHRQLLYRNIPHEYITRPGAHNWAYWTNAVDYQLLFMHKFFEKMGS